MQKQSCQHFILELMEEIKHAKKPLTKEKLAQSLLAGGGLSYEGFFFAEKLIHVLKKHIKKIEEDLYSS
jgi:hypothetical protein